MADSLVNSVKHSVKKKEKRHTEWDRLMIYSRTDCQREIKARKKERKRDREIER